MSKINRIRIINLSYNSNTIRIDDEVFELNGQTTLLSLRNGGGKTVLVQMVISLFVNSSYRNFKDRPFHSYFTTNRPTFIMTEWKLDHDNGYFLVGMMVRKCQKQEDNNESSNDGLEMYTFTGSYKEGCGYDLDTIPLIEDDNGTKVLKGFGTCKKLFEQLKVKEKSDFNFYDMSSQHFRRQYFAKLKEYQIDNKEWETIIKKVNLKESGLSELFSNAKDERGLVENWFMDAIENKLNGRHDRMKEFQKIAYKLINQYRDNQTSIRRKEVIELYREDAKEIKQQVERYELAQKALDMQKNSIAVFIREVNRIVQELRQRQEIEHEKLEELRVAMVNILRQQISYTIYMLMDKKDEATGERTESEVRIIQSRNRKDKASKEICLYECAGIYSELKEFKEEKERLQTNIRIITSQQQDTKQKVDEIGAALYSCYHMLFEQQNVKLDEVAEKMIELTERMEECIAESDLVQSRIEEMLGKKGALNQALRSYEKVESRFNHRYKEQLSRNILGEYEEGALEVKKQEYKDALQEGKIKITRLTEQSNQWKQEEERLNAKCQQTVEERGICRGQLEQMLQKYRRMQEEKKNRLLFMKYVEAPESELNQKVLLLARFDGKLKELEQQKDSYRDQVSVLKKEYDNLKQGKVIELPSNVKAYFEEQNIEYLYGMEWLKNNGKSAQQNQQLVMKNPFIPYCIILEKHAIEKLKQGRTDVYTSFLIPIVIREELEQSYPSRGGCINLGTVNFFVVFNHNLLNEQELDIILKENHFHQQELMNKIQQKIQEIEKYRDGRAEISQQSYTEELLQSLNSEREKKEKELEQLEQRYQTDRGHINELKGLQEEGSKKIALQKTKTATLEAKVSDFEELVHAYEEYCTNQQTKNRLEQKVIEERARHDKLKEKKTLLEQEQERAKETERTNREKCKEYKEKVECYSDYRTIASETIITIENKAALEAEYRALTQGIAQTIQQLQENLKTATKRFQRKEQELRNKNQYKFEKEEYADLLATELMMKGLQEELKRAQVEEDQANELNNKLSARIMELSKDIEYEKKALVEKTGNETLVDKNEIVDLDFEGRLQVTNYEIEKKQKEILELQKKIQIFARTSDVMAEYSQFEVAEEIEMIPLEKLSEAELGRYQGTLRRDLDQYKDKREKQEKETDRCIRNKAARTEYQEEYFKKSFQNLLSVISNVAHLSEQLEINCQIYDSAMKKLQVDLDIIEKERATVEESFLEYVKNIDDNMRMIDKNSTISLRGRNLKMLKINVPDWESNKEWYEVRLRDYVDSFIKRGIQSVENNENVEEILGKLITTKKLYNDVVGIGNIEIKMYKIEAEREVPITWSEVSANSGGEGFLSAFVILSCLLSYMRRDDTDLFSQGNEGKVLIMDNPFAQTNAAHLLKPLMEIAQKTNTQLICLSGLGGDSIYNRFENIYVLKLSPSSLKKGLQYMDVQHIKGEKIKRMKLAQFKIEQMSLFDIE